MRRRQAHTALVPGLSFSGIGPSRETRGRRPFDCAVVSIQSKLNPARARMSLDSASIQALNFAMDKRKPDSDTATLTLDQQAADAFAALAVKVVMKENAELPVLSVMADQKVRPNAR